jgi:hypothetical protein
MARMAREPRVSGGTARHERMHAAVEVLDQAEDAFADYLTLVARALV